MQFKRRIQIKKREKRERIIAAVPHKIVEAELTQRFFVRNTNNAGNMIYIFRAGECPNVMLEVGRLREMAFRLAGGGTGRKVDIDEDDLEDDGYQQLVVWNPAAKEILGGYRFIVSESSHPKHFSTEHYFDFSKKFREEILPHTIELGRSFVHPRYQRTRDAKGLYALDNLWDGLGTLIVRNPHVEYFFGKVTMYDHYDPKARDMLLYFLQRYFPDNDNLLKPLDPMPLMVDMKEMDAIFSGETYAENYKKLVQELRNRGEFVPPMINSYMGLSPTMRTFGTVTNRDFGEVEETAILIKISDIYPAKMHRHTDGLRAMEPDGNGVQLE